MQSTALNLCVGPPVLVEVDCSNGFVRPSVDTILSPQLLLQFLRDSHDLEMIIFYRGQAKLIFSSVMALENFSTVSLVSATPLAVFSGFSQTFELLFYDVKRIILYRGYA